MSRCRHHADYDLFSLVRIEDDLVTVVTRPPLASFLAGATLLVALRVSLWNFSGVDAIYDLLLLLCLFPLLIMICDACVIFTLF